MDTATLERQRRGALLFEVVCWAFALGGPALAGLLLSEHLPALFEDPVLLFVPLIPVLLVGGAAVGFRRLRKQIERRLRGPDGS